MADKTRMMNRTLEDTRLIFRNFAGKGDDFNTEGDRNFGVILSEEQAVSLEAEGWPVKYLKKRPDDDPNEPAQAWMKVKVKFSGRPPKINMITSRGKTPLGEEDVNILDYAEFAKVDLILSPYQWTLRSGAEGVSAYLSSCFATIVEDELDLKYADVALDGATSAQSARVHFQDEDGETPY